MKEVTEWNGKPRWMWVWDKDEKNKHKEYVVYILTEKEIEEISASGLPAMGTDCNYNHCAEIEEEPKKEIRLTNYELSQLLKCLGVEGKFKDYSEWHGEYGYNDGTEENECPNDIIIRYRQGEWETPTRETVWKWWREETPNSDIARFVSFIGFDKE